MTYKRPDVKSNRTRRSKEHSVMSQARFNEFLKKHPEHKDMTVKEFNNILKGFNSNVIQEVYNYRYGVLLPQRLGCLIIASFPKSKRKIVDFGKSNKTGVTCYHKNWDTDNRLGKIMYKTLNRLYGIKNQRVWAFEPSRDFKRGMSKVFKKNWAKFIFINNKHTTVRKMLN